MIENINTSLSNIYDAITLEFMFKFAVVYFFIIWIALIVWVMKDISIRTNNLLFQIFCIMIILILTPFGIFIYLLIRPGKTLYEKFYDEIDLNLDIISEIVEERKEKNKVKSKESSKKIEKNKEEKKKEITTQKTKIGVKTFK